MNQQFKMSYSWEDLRLVHPLFISVMIAQAIGAAISGYLHNFDPILDALWLGGALATFPGFLLGLPVQKLLLPGNMSKHLDMVLFMGTIAAAITAMAVFFPPHALVS